MNVTHISSATSPISDMGRSEIHLSNSNSDLLLVKKEGYGMRVVSKKYAKYVVKTTVCMYTGCYDNEGKTDKMYVDTSPSNNRFVNLMCITLDFGYGATDTFTEIKK